LREISRLSLKVQALPAELGTWPIQANKSLRKIFLLDSSIFRTSVRGSSALTKSIGQMPYAFAAGLSVQREAKRSEVG